MSIKQLLKGEGFSQQKIDETVGNLNTILCWLQSSQCPEEVFDNVTDYGDLTESVDEVVNAASTLIQLFDENA